MAIKMEVYKCMKCGNIVEVLHQGNGDLMCCGEKMILIDANTVEASKEKHIPFIEERENENIIRIGETPHPMTSDHYIEWMEVMTDRENIKTFFSPGDKAEISLHKRFNIVSARAYCNQHGLWRKTNLDSFSRENIMLFAMKSETESERVYMYLADRVKNAFLKERMKFLASEEIKHREYFENLYKKTYLDKKIVIPDDNLVPLPKIDTKDLKKPMSEVLELAMEAELAAHNFYLDASEKFSDMKKTQDMLKFFASMEMMHYNILSAEKKNAETMEAYEEEVPMIHVGP